MSIPPDNDFTWIAHPVWLKLRSRLFDSLSSGPNQIDFKRADSMYPCRSVCGAPVGEISRAGNLRAKYPFREFSRLIWLLLAISLILYYLSLLSMAAKRPISACYSDLALFGSGSRTITGGSF